jgi:hypothetical protein
LQEKNNINIIDVMQVCSVCYYLISMGVHPFPSAPRSATSLVEAEAFELDSEPFSAAT